MSSHAIRIYAKYLKQRTPDLGESTVVPNVTVMGETVPDESKSTLFDILFDRIKRFLFADFHLRIGPSRNFDDHVEDTVVLVGEERDVMEG